MTITYRSTRTGRFISKRSAQRSKYVQSETVIKGRRVVRSGYKVRIRVRPQKRPRILREPFIRTTIEEEPEFGEVAEPIEEEMEEPFEEALEDFDEWSDMFGDDPRYAGLEELDELEDFLETIDEEEGDKYKEP